MRAGFTGSTNTPNPSFGKTSTKETHRGSFGNIDSTCRAPRSAGCSYNRAMALDGVIFDVDGTLVDSNPLHIKAWERAFKSRGYHVNPDRIADEVGKGGDLLVPSILGKQADEDDGDALRAAQPVEFRNLAKEHGLNIFPGAIELLA